MSCPWRQLEILHANFDWHDRPHDHALLYVLLGPRALDAIIQPSTMRFFMRLWTRASLFVSLLVIDSARSHGEARAVGRYDYFADILITPPNQDPPFICGGTLIRSDIVLTAAQCLVEGATVLVRVGAISANDGTPWRETLGLWPHEEYAFGFENDIMIIKLREPVVGIEPVQYNVDERVPSRNVELTLFGFGALSELNLAPSNLLRETEVLVGSFSECNRQYGSRLNEDIHICALGPTNGAEDACHGDGGAPLIIKGDDTSSDLQVGIVSFGVGCGRAGSYSGYSSTAGYAQWIQDTVCRFSNDRPSDCPSQGLIFCFSGSSVVQTLERGPMRLSNVKIGDHVMVEPNTYEQIYSFGHYKPTSRAQFLEILTEQTTLRVSSDHMVFVSDHRTIPAAKLRVGDEIVHSSGMKVVIVHIKTTVASGVFAPFTPSGKIIVDGIQASCFVAFENAESLELFGVSFSYQWIAHCFEAFHRLVCHRLGSCPRETYSDEGISHWVAAPRKFFLWVLQQPSLIRHVLLGTALVVLSVLTFMEQRPALVFCLCCWVTLRRFQTRKMDAASK